MAVENLPDFTRPARQRWESIPADIRQRLLALLKLVLPGLEFGVRPLQFIDPRQIPAPATCSRCRSRAS